MNIDELKKQYKEKKIECINISNQITPLNIKKRQLLQEQNYIREQIEKLELEQINNDYIKHYILSKKIKYEYIGETNGSCEHYLINKIYIECDKCKEYFKLLSHQTGVGEVVIGVCPKCEYEINFTDYSKW